MRSDILPLVYVMLGAALWGIIGLFTRSLNPFITPLQMVMVRGAITLVFIFFAILIVDRRLFRIDVKDIWMFIGTGLFSIVFFNLAYFTTQQMISLSTASVLLYTAPCFVVIMSAILFKEKITKNKMLALILAFVGCIFTTGIGLGDINIGILYGLMAGFGYSLYSIFAKFALVKYKLLTILFYTFLVCTVCLIPFSDVPQIIDACSNQTVLLNVLGLSILSTVLPYYFYTTGLSKMDAGKASIIAFTEPMVATIVSLCVGDPFGIMNVIGIALILGSLILLNMNNKDPVQGTST